MIVTLGLQHGDYLKIAPISWDRQPLKDGPSFVVAVSCFHKVAELTMVYGR